MSLILPVDPPMAMAKSRKRPRSRGSTASIHSATTQGNLDQTYTDNSAVYSQQWLANQHNHPQPRELAIAPAPPTHDISPESMILQAASHLQNVRDFSVEAPDNASLHNASFQRASNLSRHSVSADSFNGNASFADDSQMLDRDGDEADSFVGAPGNVKPQNKSSANNELEMRQLFTAHKHRTLQDVAEELHGNERGPNSERTRQVFAMLWINQVCTRGKGSVPRGRVYANYASRCATERITVLNPASFGKLVRVLFPGLKTRRLGVRGESKYHYVNFTLLEDQPEVAETPVLPQMPLLESRPITQNFNILPAQASAPRPDRAVFPAVDVPPQPPQQTPIRSHEFSHSLYNQPIVNSYDQLQSAMGKTAQKLRFAPEVDAGFNQGEALVLPSIEPFLPNGTDPDTAKSLTALYRSHCTSLVECIRYCKEKTFFHLFTSFHGTLTMPVQKLFGNPALAPWIEECDFVLYQRMMRIVSGLTLQVVPKPVLDTLRSISERLVPHIRESFQGQPLHVIRAKEAPAALFASLLDRALRVNLTAHAAANMLSNPANRDLMYMEWITLVYPRKVAECVPSRGMDDVVTLLLTEIRDLLDPVNIPWEMECITLHGDVALKTGRQPQAEHAGDGSVANVLDRWVNFLRSLPQRFPYASDTDIVWCVQRVGTAVMRDLTIAQGKSFGSWWVTKCWIDEMIQFLAEQGGFMTQKSTRTPAATVAPRLQYTQQQQQQPQQQPPQIQRQDTVSRQGSRYSSGSDEFAQQRQVQQQPQHQQSQPHIERAQIPNGQDPNMGQQSIQSHDDSGIGIRTPDEDLPPMGDSKFVFTPNTAQELFAAEMSGVVAL
ncbi:Transcriptional regulator RFX1 [Coniochaeta hoffmannii]|uniref:Transcriptional regulator RFX1 n=1 Tax=Coniochaeta hoffmannii TaxID=91930 RepID=A0AA38VRE5_9PEZI|nr:Transcriptional regulator RFX1 [Coniochaeta hoffmannii]